MTDDPRRLPAEWEPQDAILLTWPHAGTDWAALLEEVLPLYEHLVATLSRVGHVLVGVPAPEHHAIPPRLRSAGAVMDRVHLYPVRAEDTWARDHGPITVETPAGPCLLDFQFNGWGNKYPGALDNAITGDLYRQGAFPGAGYEWQSLVLEGGSIESDGHGTLLTTSTCLLNPNRNPGMDREQIEAALQQVLGARKVNWLHHGAIEGDDTDSHIDTLARLCPDHRIAFQACDETAYPHYDALQRMAEELGAMTDVGGTAYILVPLPWPEPRYDGDGHRLPATYANFLVFNGTVFVPTYRAAQDDKALAAVAQAFPGYRVEGVDCLPLIHQHGSLHCISMQLPRGVLNP